MLAKLRKAAAVATATAAAGAGMLIAGPVAYADGGGGLIGDVNVPITAQVPVCGNNVSPIGLGVYGGGDYQATKNKGCNSYSSNPTDNKAYAVFLPGPGR